MERQIKEGGSAVVLVLEVMVAEAGFLTIGDAADDAAVGDAAVASNSFFLLFFFLALVSLLFSITPSDS
jgi:hypothetical protein